MRTRDTWRGAAPGPGDRISCSSALKSTRGSVAGAEDPMVASVVVRGHKDPRDGRSLEEIAVDLYVSVNAVRTHVRAIHAKRGVAARRDTVAVARQRGLLGLGAVDLLDLDVSGGFGRHSERRPLARSDP